MQFSSGGEALPIALHRTGIPVERLASSEQKTQLEHGTDVGTGPSEGCEVEQPDIRLAHEGRVGLEDFRRVCADGRVIVERE